MNQKKDGVNNLTRLIPAHQWNSYHDWPPPGGLRHLIFNADKNGFAPAIKRVGRRVLIDEKKFFECVEATDKKHD